ncbi:MAG: hypothetical protein FH761_07160 [Firmicutes bacterium]|nr:hypothetical protein [Bacillota bacterium]
MKDVFETIVLNFEDETLKSQVDDLYNRMQNQDLQFNSKIDQIIITQSSKKRIVLNVERESLEELTLKYLKKRLDNIFNIKYPNRTKIMRNCFSIFRSINKMRDFVIFRYDFKDFFQSVRSADIFDRYIASSNLSRFEKDILETMTKLYDRCFPGLPTSNAFIEIITRDFDLRLRAKLVRFGLISYYRYVDDGIMVFNRYIDELEIKNIIRETLREVFIKSKVKLNKNKITYMSKSSCQEEDFTYLGYYFKITNENNKIKFKYGISEKKLKKYRNKLLKIIKDYKDNKKVELFRQRLQFLISRVVFYNNFSSKYSKQANWDVIGIVSNYYELRNYINQSDKITYKTEKFLTRELIDIIDDKLGSENRPFFLKNEYKAYTLKYGMENKKSIVFHPNIGWSQQHLINKINRLDSSVSTSRRSYRELVKIYISLLKL